MEAIQATADQVDIGKWPAGLQQIDLVLRMGQHGVDNRRKAAAGHRGFSGIAGQLDDGGDQTGRIDDLAHGGMKQQCCQRRIAQRHGLQCHAERGIFADIVDGLAERRGLGQQRAGTQRRQDLRQGIAGLVAAQHGAQAAGGFGVRIGLFQGLLHAGHDLWELWLEHCRGQAAISNFIG